MRRLVLCATMAVLFGLIGCASRQQFTHTIAVRNVGAQNIANVAVAYVPGHRPYQFRPLPPQAWDFNSTAGPVPPSMTVSWQVEGAPKSIVVPLGTFYSHLASNLRGWDIEIRHDALAVWAVTGNCTFPTICDHEIKKRAQIYTERR